jgi:cell wall-associated NlpC family hydrolase
MDSRYSEAVIEVASGFKGIDFRHHFRPDNICDDGYLTLDSCMERGLDENGFDCSGLVIASICRAIDLPTSSWDRNFRHLSQLRELQEDIPAHPGDALVFHYYDHIGIMSSDRSFIHSSGLSKKVEETVLKGAYATYQTIPLARLAILSSAK